MLPLLLGTGLRLTPSVSTDAALTLTGHRALPGGAVEITYSCA